MKDIAVSKGYNPDKIIKCTDSTAEMKEKHFRTEFEKNIAFDENTWNSSVLRVSFKNESFARKYKVKIERFLKDLLDEGEEFVVCPSIHVNDEQEFEENEQSFRIDKNYDETPDKSNVQKIPVYSSSFEDTLNSKEEETDEKTEEEKPSLMTCFNCLGDHHMRNCPEKLDRVRINANKKEILLSGSIRYHTDDQNNGFKAGVISDNLREALGLKKDQLPRFIYHMRVIGYPPGWMNEALFEKSGLALFDSDGKATDDSHTLSGTGTLYDAAKFIDFPGFNIPVPEGFVDEWKSLNMPPLQAHQQLQEALKSPNIIMKINSNNLYKRKPNTEDDVDCKKQKNAEQPCSPISKVNVSENDSTSPGRFEESLEFKTPESKQKNKRHSMSISQSPGTPVLDKGNPFKKLPDADKFAQGITEHLPFENLPDAVGTFEKMRGVISSVQKKLNDIKKS